MVQSGEIDHLPSQQAQAQSEMDDQRPVPVGGADIDSDGLEQFSDSDPDADAEGESEPSSPPSDQVGGCITVIRSQPVIVRQASSDSSSSTESLDGVSPYTARAEDQVSVQTPARPHWATGPSDLPKPVPSTKKATSTKSSYSSLSAASAMMGSSHSRSTSGTNSLRSVSSSSSNSVPPSLSSLSEIQATSHDAITGIPIDPRLAHLKRPAPSESFARSSRARVEDILTLSETHSTWAPEHFPHSTVEGGFHIGDPPSQHSMPMSLPYIPYDTHQGYTGDLTPYVMAPNAWSTDTTFTYLPHIAQPEMSTGTSMGMGGYGGFDMPPEYDFTFTQEPTSAK